MHVIATLSVLNAKIGLSSSCISSVVFEIDRFGKAFESPKVTPRIAISTCVVNTNTRLGWSPNLRSQSGATVRQNLGKMNFKRLTYDNYET